MLCVAPQSDGTLVVLTPQPADVTSCTAVVISGAESSQLGSIFQPLTVSQAATIGSAIWAAWAVAWGFRVLIRQAGPLSFDGGSGDD